MNLDPQLNHEPQLKHHPQVYLFLNQFTKMAESSTSKAVDNDSAKDVEDGFLRVQVYHDGAFSPNPIVYFSPLISTFTEVDFKSMRYTDFINFLKKLVKDRVPAVYYCLPHRSLKDGLRGLVDDNDYVRFLDCANGNEGRIDVYVDHCNEPILEWIADERDAEGGTDSDSSDSDVDTVISDNLSVDLEGDDEATPVNLVDDPFLCKKTVIPAHGVHDGNDNSTEIQQYPVYDPDQAWDTVVPIVGMRFSGPLELKHMLTDYAVANGYKLWYEKNDSKRLLVRCCKTEEKPCCPFRLWATWMSTERSFQIKTLMADHNCARSQDLGAMVTYRWIGKRLLNDILERPKLSYRKMRAEVLKKFNLRVSVGQCRNAKKFALEEIEGSLEAHYAKIRSYGAELLRANPGSTVKLDVDIMPDSTIHFSKIYVCLKGVKDGWVEGCRRVIGIDGCFLKGICRGELLSAVGRDANNQMYPLAWAVVAVENKETWKWFLDLLLDDIEMGDGRGLTLISDGHKV